MKQTKARIEDALHATRAAVEEGILPGGGVALLRCIEAVEAVKCKGDERIGVEIVARALQAPIRQIADNGGHDDGFIGPRTPPATQLMYRYTERLEEQSQILLSLLITAYHENLKFGRNPKDLPSLITQAHGKGLYLAEWDKNTEISAASGWLITARGIHYLYYRAQPTPAVEIMSVALDGDPQITVMRAPERQGSPVVVQNDIAPEGTAGIVVYTAPSGDARLLPAWSSTADYEQWGWRRENLKISMGNAARQDDLKRWIDSQAPKQ